MTAIWGTTAQHKHESNRDQINLPFSPQKNIRLTPSNHIHFVADEVIFFTFLLHCEM
jgi:hypothetical protein